MNVTISNTKEINSKFIVTIFIQSVWENSLYFSDLESAKDYFINLTANTNNIPIQLWDIENNKELDSYCY